MWLRRDAAGNAIGGLSVGEPEEEMYDICAGLLRGAAGVGPGI